MKAIAFTVINTTEFCDCDLNAGDFYLPRTFTDCAGTERDHRFQSQYYENRVLFDFVWDSVKTTASNKQLNDMQQAAAAMTNPVNEVPEIIRLPYSVAPENPEYKKKVLNQSPNHFRRDLKSFVGDVKANTDGQFYVTKAEFLDTGKDFKETIKKMTTHELHSFIGSIVAYIALIAVIIFAVYFGRKLWKLKFAGKSEAALTTRLAAVATQFRGGNTQTLFPWPTENPKDTWDIIHKEFEQIEKMEKHEEEVVRNTQIMYYMIAVAALLAFLLILYRKMRRKSSLWRVCFPVYPRSAIKRGIPKVDLFLQVVEISKAKMLWAHIGVTTVPPDQIRIRGVLTLRDLKIARTCFCCKYVEINWDNVFLITDKLTPIAVSRKAPMSMWTPNQIEKFSVNQAYSIKIMARILDIYYTVQSSRMDEMDHLTFDSEDISFVGSRLSRLGSVNELETINESRQTSSRRASQGDLTATPTVRFAPPSFQPVSKTPISSPDPAEVERIRKRLEFDQGATAHPQTEPNAPEFEEIPLDTVSMHEGPQPPPYNYSARIMRKYPKQPKK